MGFIDIITLVLCGWGFRRGWRRGVSRELYRIVQLVVACLVGLGLFRAASTLLSGILGQSSGLAGFLVTFGAGYGLVRLARRKLHAWATSKLAGYGKIAGGLAGLLRGGLLATALIVGLSQVPIAPLRDAAVEKSIAGRVVQLLVPGVGSPDAGE